MKNSAKPFLKWAGGKGRLLQQFEEYYPKELKENNIKKYIEPFIGGGAVFFSLQQKYDFEEIVLNDINEELILVYSVIKNDVETLIEKLRAMQNEFKEKTEEEQKDFYLQIRDKFNEVKGAGIEPTKKLNCDAYIYQYKTLKANFREPFICHATNMIFLNRTCFNGLYRQNKSGGFNVPFGKYSNPLICDEENLREVSKALKNVTLTTERFREVENYIDIDENTFIYMDPPYRPLSETSSFTDYAKFSFEDRQQKLLIQWTKSLSEKGAKVMYSNSYSDEDKFIEDVFKDAYSENEVYIDSVMAGRAINSKAENRGKIKELLVVNYKTNKQLKLDEVAITEEK